MPLVDLAVATKISASKWSQYFNNKCTISERNLIKAAIALGIEPEQVLGYINDRRIAVTLRKQNKESLKQ
ncbi:MAG: helix-turn-helix domain-containing protein [Chroococcidiopsis sp.]